MILVDSNVLIDLANPLGEWTTWSADALARAANIDRLAINPIIYAEISAAYAQIEDLEEAIPATDFLRQTLPYEAAFLAGKAFVRYRRRGGERRSPLPDFYVGAHAAVAGMTLLTRDPQRYRSYFPTVKLISP